MDFYAPATPSEKDPEEVEPPHYHRLVGVRCTTTSPRMMTPE
jgi:hypothetical protein